MEVKSARALCSLGAASSPSPGGGGCHIGYPFWQTERAPGRAVPRPALGQLQSACKPPCHWVFTPRSSSLELGLTHSEHKLVKGSGEERRAHTRGGNEHAQTPVPLQGRGGRGGEG